MSVQNDIFFEEFKGLEKLCREMGEQIGEQYGVTAYINEMKEASEYDYRNILGWNDDLKHLIHIRSIRNSLAHEQGTLNKEICTQEDIDWIKNFHERILKQSDSLAMLHQNKKKKEQKIKNSDRKNDTEKTKEQVNVQEYKENNKFTIHQTILLFIIIIAAILLIAVSVKITFG